MIVTAITYDKKATIAYLTNIFREGLLQGTDREVAILEDSLALRSVLSRSPDDSAIKVTMEMNTSITHDFEDPRNKMTHVLKVALAGLSKTDAQEYLKQTGRVKESTITSYPFWNRSVSNNVDNIEFVIVK